MPSPSPVPTYPDAASHYTPPVPEPLSVSFSFSRDDYLAAMRAWIDHAPEMDIAARQMRRKTLKSSWWAFPVMAVLAYMIPSRTPLDRELRTAGGVVMAAVLCGLYFMHLSSLGNYRKQVRKTSWERVEREDVSGFSGPLSATIAEDGLAFNGPNGGAAIPWQSVGDVREIGEWLFIRVPHGLPVIPASAFGSAESRAAFAASIRQHADTARVPEAERIRRYMAERDLPCPGCKYNLRGIAADACPECGRQLRYAELVS
jgi:hypothetical protein